MLLKSMLTGLEFECVRGNLDIEITGVQQDSRKVTQGTLFLAIKGFKSDGHDYIEKAIQLGAVAVVVTEASESTLKLAEAHTVTVIKVTDDRFVMSALAASMEGQPSENLIMVGLTGTNGKTSTCRIITDMLNAVDIPTGLLGTIANVIGGKTYKSSLTTPEPIELHHLLGLMVKDDIKACVMEASSHALDLKRVDHIDFDYAVFTNLTEDHLDYHADFEEYFMAKAKLFDLAGKGRLINVDDTYGKRLYDLCLADGSLASTLSYGIDSKADIHALDIEYTEYGSKYTLATPTGKVKVVIPLPGKIYVYNTLAAFGVLYMLGLSLDKIQSVCENIGLVPGRMELVQKDADVRVFVDYAHTPDALSNAIDIARSVTEGRVLTVFGCGGDRDSKKRPLMGEIAEEKSDLIFVTSDNPRTEDPNIIMKDILAGIKQPELAVVEALRDKAIGLAIEKAQKGDVVLIAGKGHETYQEIDGTRHDFDDRKIALGYLNTEA